MEQCTCKCKACEPKVEEPQAEEPKIEEKPKLQPHNIRYPRRLGIHAFQGQEKEEVVKLLQKAEKQERIRLDSFMQDRTTGKEKLTYEDDATGNTSWGMPQFNREPTRTVDDAENDDTSEECEGANLFAMQKLAGVTEIDMPTYKASVSVKEKVVAALGQKYYGKLRFEWSDDPESYLDQFLLVNNAKTKISVSPLVEIFEAVSKISDEDDAIDVTCQVVISKVSSLFE